jgi:hypothetical protein
MKRVLPIGAILALAGCGQVSNLRPPAGKSLPVKPAMARTTPTAKDLLVLPPQAKPDRVDELIKRSLPRRSDPFNLPPPTGGPAPVVPDETANQTSATPGD